MFKASKAAADGRQRRRPSIGRKKVESTADLLRATTKTLGDIANLFDEAIDEEEENGRKATSPLKLVQKALPLIHSAVSQIAVIKISATGSSAVNYAISRTGMNQDENNRNSIEAMQHLPSQRHHKSDSFSANRALESNAELLLATKTLGHIANLIDEAIDDEEDNGREVTSPLKLVQKALPLIQRKVSQITVKASGKGSSAVNYVISRIKTDAKRRMAIEAMQLPSQRHTPDSFSAVQAFVDSKENTAALPSSPEPSEPEISTPRTWPTTRQSLAPFPTTEETLEFPKPCCGTKYSPKEVVSILATFQSKPNARKMQAEVKKAMVEKGLVGPTTVHGLNRFLGKVMKSDGLHVPEAWSQKGRPGMLTLDELRLIAAKMRVERGRTIELETFMPLVVDFLRDKYQKEGKAPAGVDIKPSKRTVSTIIALLAVLNEQTNASFTAENSLMSAS